MRQSSSLFGYYGAKSKIINLYPEPAYRTIIEPFCGGACYALRWHEHDVWLNDLNPNTVAAWRFLQRPEALDIVARRIPHHVDAGTPLADLIREDDDAGFVEVVRAGCGRGSYGMWAHAPKSVPWVRRHGVHGRMGQADTGTSC